MSRLFESHSKVWWILYLLTSHTVFSLPEPGFSQGPVYIPPTSYAKRYSTYNATQTPPESDMIGVFGAEPITASSYFTSEIDNLLTQESSPFFRGSRREPARKPRPKPPRRHPPPIKLSKPPPPQKPVLIKPSKLVKPKPKSKPKPDHHHVPNKSHKNHVHDFSKELRFIKPSSNRRPSLQELSRETGSSVESYSLEYSKPRRENKREREREHDYNRDREREHVSKREREREHGSKRERERELVSNRDRDREHDSNQSFSQDEYYPSTSSTEMNSASHEDIKTREPSKNPIPQPSTLRQPGHQAPFPKPPRPVHLSYYYDSNDKKDLTTLITSHHLKRRGKECDGLENFVYDLEVISFLMGVVSAIIGFYSDVIPFFNDGVKISYSNNYGDGEDFPHDYWNNHDGKIDAVGDKRTISIGTSEDNIKEVVSVCGEFISLLGLGISFVTLFPSLVEKFFYSLDWWFGKRGLWKQYLYTYKCEIHPYPKVGWARR